MKRRKAKASKQVMDLGHGDSIDAAESRWAEDVSPTHAHFYALSARILYVARQIQHSFEGESNRFGLNTGEALVLDALRRLGPPYEATPSRLKDHFFVSFAGIGKRLTRLEELGFIVRTRDLNDRRAQVVKLTEAGLATTRPDYSSDAPIHIQAMARMNDTELESLMTCMRKLQYEIDFSMNKENN